MSQAGKYTCLAVADFGIAVANAWLTVLADREDCSVGEWRLHLPALLVSDASVCRQYENELFFKKCTSDVCIPGRVDVLKI